MSILTSELATKQLATKPKLLLVDDDPSIVSQLSVAFEDDYVVLSAQDPNSAWGVVQKEHPDLMTLDLALEAGNPETGFTLLDKCLAFDPALKVVLITGSDTRENARRGVERGAYDFFGKPVDLNELGVLLKRAAQLRSLEGREETQRTPPREDRLGSLLGRSREMHAVFRLIQRVAPTDVTVLILGESGTGKEVVAREIHRLSLRAEKPFVSISCAAIPENLLESELFGHEKGSFTSAHTTRPGRLELADGGSVFLDEIGDMPMTLQVKLLRFLQEREIERVGGRRVIPLDVRVVAATNRNLQEDVKSGRFREDLYYRLSVIDIRLPSLRERREDIVFLADHFLKHYSRELNRAGLVLSRAAKEAIQNHPWPGHVRELEHRMQRAVLLANGRMIQPADLELDRPGTGTMLSLKEARDHVEMQTVVEALRHTAGNISKAAKALDVSRPTLHDLLRKHQIDARTFRTGGPSPDDAEGD
jgi:two-component system, NtrC family, response regulator